MTVARRWERVHLELWSALGVIRGGGVGWSGIVALSWQPFSPQNKVSVHDLTIKIQREFF